MKDEKEAERQVCLDIMLLVGICADILLATNRSYQDQARCEGGAIAVRGHGGEDAQEAGRAFKEEGEEEQDAQVLKWLMALLYYSRPADIAFSDKGHKSDSSNVQQEKRDHWPWINASSLCALQQQCPPYVQRGGIIFLRKLLADLGMAWKHKDPESYLDMEEKPRHLCEHVFMFRRFYNDSSTV